ncbi:hypothetical protein JW960_14710 [candidate division KSB1 bacterium]|nr:hypothetical protein [candidate division KSB1 bacterium]
MSAIAKLKIEYYNELVNRLFHSQSYFIHSIDELLTKLDGTNDPKIKESIFLIKNLVQYLVDTDKTIDELDLVCTLPGFTQLNTRLKERVERINFSGSDPDKMKEIIKKIAQFITQEIRSILRSTIARRALMMHLGLEFQTSATPNLPASTENHASATPDDNSNEEQSAVFETDDADLLNELNMYQSEFDEAINLDEQININDTFNEEMDSDELAPDDQHREDDSEDNVIGLFKEFDVDDDLVSVEEDVNSIVEHDIDNVDDIENDLTVGEVVDPEIIDDAPTTDCVPEIEVDENLDLADKIDMLEELISEEADFKLDEYENEPIGEVSKTEDTTIETDFMIDSYKNEILESLKLIEKHKSIQENVKSFVAFLNKWEKVGQQIKLTAMMYGFDDVEAIATRIIRVVNYHRASDATPVCDYTAKLLNFGTEKIIDSVNKQQTKQPLIDVLSRFDAYLKNPKSVITANMPFSEPEDLKQTTLNETKEPINDLSIAEINQNTSNDDTVATEDDRADIEFKLPGEDDPELLALIEEISNHKDSEVAVDEFEDDDEIFEKIDIIDEPNSPQNAHQASIIKETTHANPEHAQVVNKIFNFETSLYFRLINNALKILSDNNSDESALEDLELAASSLKTHALKFGFEKLSELPHIIEEIAIETIELKNGIPEIVLGTIAEAIILLQTFVDNDENRDNYKSILFEMNYHLQYLIKQRKTVIGY